MLFIKAKKGKEQFFRCWVILSPPGWVVDALMYNPIPPKYMKSSFKNCILNLLRLALSNMTKQNRNNKQTNQEGQILFPQHSTSLLCSALPQSISAQKTRHHLLPSSEEPSVLYSQQRSMLCAVLGHMAEVEGKHWSVCGLVSLDLSLKAVCVCSLPRSLIHTR